MSLSSFLARFSQRTNQSLFLLYVVCTALVSASNRGRRCIIHFDGKRSADEQSRNHRKHNTTAKQRQHAAQQNAESQTRIILKEGGNVVAEDAAAIAVAVAALEMADETAVAVAVAVVLIPSILELR